MIILGYILAYICVALLAAVTIKVIAKVGQWNQEAEDVGTILGAMFWPLALPFIIFVLLVVALDPISCAIVRRLRGDKSY